MKAYEASATVDGEGEVHVPGVPFAPGTQVEVVIHPKRSSAEQFTNAWEQACRQMRAVQPSIREEEIQKEIDDYRAGR